ncbi:MAG TPA: hypothetical protein VK456_15400, partial [Xanthobacteraceae bacterium]|nr:hypothetical protein [Xanthobacteraceae bacterium]
MSSVDHGSKNGNATAVLLGFFRDYKRFRIPFLIILLIFIFSAAALLIYYCWYLALPTLWAWGFGGVSWRAIPAVFGLFYLLIGPFVPFYLFLVFPPILNLYLEEEEKSKQQALIKIKSEREKIEEELEAKDDSGLVSLVRYSRLQLEEYYRIGLDETKKSFR